jgi:hypothetical protein
MFAKAMIRGVGYGPVGVVPGVFMMSQEYRPCVAIGGIAPGMFHVEHFRVRGMFGYECSTWNIATGPTRVGSEIPKAWRSIPCHRSGDPRGGSETTMTPPVFTSSDDHFRVKSGGPNPRAHAASNECPVFVVRAKLSTSAHTTDTRSSMPNALTDRNKASVRFDRRSTRVSWISGRAIAMTSPGTPAPLPRSTQVWTDWGRASAKAQAWLIMSFMGCAPRAPMR